MKKIRRMNTYPWNILVFTEIQRYSLREKYIKLLLISTLIKILFKKGFISDDSK